MIAQERAVMKQALEALEAMKAEFRAYDLPYGSKAYTQGNEASHILRAALAQQAEPVSAADLVQRIRELRDEAAKMFIESGSPGYKLHDLYRMKLDAILVAPPQQPEPVQKPVAVVRSVVGQGDEGVRIKWLGGFPQIGDPLYTTPPQRPPLTNAEIAQEVYRKWGMLPGTNSVITEFARAIERRVRGE